MTIRSPATDERLPLYASNTFEIPGLELEQHLGLCWGLIVISLGENAVPAEFVAYGSAIVVKTG